METRFECVRASIPEPGVPSTDIRKDICAVVALVLTACFFAIAMNVKSDAWLYARQCADWTLSVYSCSAMPRAISSLSSLLDGRYCMRRPASSTHRSAALFTRSLISCACDPKSFSRIRLATGIPSCHTRKRSCAAFLEISSDQTHSKLLGSYLHTSR